jgi:DNA-binding MarR family transcriptional regulator
MEGDAGDAALPQGPESAGNSFDIWLHRWRRAMHWRRGVEAALRPLGLTLAQWRVLDGLATLIRETGDAVSQVQVARRLEMDKSTLSQVMDVLVRRQFIDRDLSYSSPAYRIYLTELGKGTAAEGRARVETASAAGFRERQQIAQTSSAAWEGTG